MAAWTKAPQLAGEGHQKLMPAIGAADAGDTLVEDAAVEVAMDREFHTAAQITMGGLEALLVDQEEALEVVGESAVEDGALGSPGAVDAYVGRGVTPLHSNKGSRNRRP